MVNKVIAKRKEILGKLLPFLLEKKNRSQGREREERKPKLIEGFCSLRFGFALGEAKKKFATIFVGFLGVWPWERGKEK